MAFGSVHNHSDGSNTRGFMDSTIKVEDLIEYARELNHIGVVLTDHDTITNHKRALNYIIKAKKENPEKWKDFKFGLGNEIYLCGRKDIEEDKKYKFYHFILVAKDLIGHEQIRTLSTRAWVDNSFTWVNIRTPTFYDDLFEIVEADRGHLIASTACLGGQCPEYILEAYKENPNNPNYKRARTWLKRMEQCFGKGNFFLELQPSLQEDQKIVNKAYIQLSEELDIPYIWTNDSHYLRKEDRPVHEAFLKSNDDGGKEREVGDFYASTYLMSEEEIHSYTDDYLGYDVVQKGLNNTKLIFDQIEEYSLDQELVIPYLPLEETEPDIKLVNKYKDKIPLLKEYAISDHQCNRHLTKIVLEKIEANQEELANQETYEAIEDNLNTIKLISKKTGQQWSGYLLQVRDLVATCWEAGSLCGCSRGSGMGFVLLYLLDISQINPLKEDTKTYPWRFLNPERVSVPDVDSDMENLYRDDIISLLQHKYCGDNEKLGKRRVMKVQTLSTVKAKSAIQTAARGLGVTPEEAQFLSSFIVAPRGMQYNLTQTFYGDKSENLLPNTEFVNLMTGKYKDVWNVAKNIEGLINGVGSHAGGVIITSQPIEKYCALMKTSSGDIITQYDLHEAEKAGLIKDDVLSIDALQKIHICLNLLLNDNLIEWQGSLKATYEKYIGIYNIERDNPEIWDMICDHKVISLFQMEKESGIQAIKVARPRSITDLAALNSVMRLMAPEPGAESPLERYGRFRKNIQLWYDEMTEYGLNEHDQEVVKKYALENYGLLPNQEDFMIIVQDPEIGGFSLLWADKLRKSVAKKVPKDFLQLQDEFFTNAKEKHLSMKLCEYVWNVLISMSKGYGFNKAHTASYSLIALQEANLAYHYPIIYWNTANLISDSGGEDSTVAYGKNSFKIYKRRF